MTLNGNGCELTVPSGRAGATTTVTTPSNRFGQSSRIARVVAPIQQPG